MTIEEAKDKLIAWAEEQAGTHEGANNYNRYASSPDMTKLYGWNVQNQPWCDIFVDCGFIECFGYDVGSAMTYQFAGCNGAACNYSADYYKARGAFFTTPERGDQIFFYSGGTIGHTGIVVEVNANAVETIEGNTSDMVARRVYPLDSPSIAGYGRPNWAIAGRDIIVPTTPNPEPVKPTPQKPQSSYHKHIYKVSLNLLKQGDYGPLVKNMQILLNAHGYQCLENGWFDSTMVTAVTAFQTDNKLHVDGEIGSETYDSLFYT